jgi:hypothetical protein
MSGIDEVTRGLINVILKDGSKIKISGPAEFAISIGVIALGWGLKNFLSRSSVNADKFPDVNITGVRAAKK